MKKILALLLALVMALGCVGAFAEETQAEDASFEIPAFTVVCDSTVNVDALLALLPAFSADETTLAMMQTFLPLLAETSIQLVFADNGAQLDVALKGQQALTVAGEQVEGGFALASDILPSYVLTLSNETIEAIMQQFTAQTEEAFANVNFEELIANFMGYAMQFGSAVTEAVSYGDAEMGEFVFEDMDLTFNCRTPIIIDLDAIKAAMENLIAQLEADESFGSLINAIASSGVPMDMSEETVVVLPDEVTVYAYANVDEEGNQVDDISLVTVETVTTAEEVTVNVNVVVLVEENAVTVGVEIAEQDISLTVHFEPTEEGGAFILCVFEGMGIEAMEAITITLDDSALSLYSESYLMDMENPIAVETIAFCFGGERTFAVLDENKTAFPVEQLMSGEADELSQALVAELSANLMAKLYQIMPEEMAGLMSMFSPAVAVEEVAE